MHRALRAGGLAWWLPGERDRPPLDATGGPGGLAATLARIASAVRAADARDGGTGRRKARARLRLAPGPGPDDALVKHSEYRGVAAWRRALAGSKARHELRLAETAAARGIPTPVPLAAGEERRGPRLRRCLLVVPIVPGAVDLRRAQAEPLAPTVRRATASALGALVRRMGEAGIFQEDPAPNNFLVSLPGDDAPERGRHAGDARGAGPAGAAPALYAIDFERARLRPPGPPGEAAARFVLAKLERELPAASRGERMRFLRAWAGDRTEARAWWRRIEAEVPRRARRDLARLRRTTTRPGRRFAPLPPELGRGFALRDLPSGAAEALRRPQRPDDPRGPIATTGPPLDRRRASERWALAELLHHRHLVPRPLALRAGPVQAVLLLERPAGARPLDAAPREEARAALRALLRRLLALGRLEESPALAAEAFRLAPHGGRLVAWWLDPRGLVTTGAPDPGGGARALALAGRILP